MDATPLWLHSHLPLAAMIAGASALATWLFTWPVRAFALHYRVVARTNHRRWNDRVVPLLGGTAIFFVLAGLSGLVSGPSLLIPLGMIFVVGWVDDWIEISALPKFSVELIASALLLWLNPHYVEALARHGIPVTVGYPLLMVWLVGITNAFNFVDGMDGLCAGTGAVCALGMWLATGDPMACGLLGACVGFLFHNRAPARIFLGDSGSLVVGFTLAALSIRIPFAAASPNAMWVPVILLGYPILDVLLAVSRRLRSGKSIFQGDRQHLHHRLERLGFRHPEAVGVLCGLGAAFNLLAIAALAVEARWIPALFTVAVGQSLGVVFWMAWRERALLSQAPTVLPIAPRPAETPATASGEAAAQQRSGT